MIKGSCTTTIKKKTYKIKVFIVVILNLGLLSTDRGLALGALGGAFNGIGGGRGWGGGGGGFGGWGGGGFGGPVVNSGYPYGTIGKLIFWFYRWHSFKS
jgi:hypothetical protein